MSADRLWAPDQGVLSEPRPGPRTDMPSMVEPSVPATTERTREPVFEAANISMRYGVVMAVDDVSLSVGKGEVVGLIGPNGAGKTTFIDAVSGFISPTAGTARLRGQCIDTLRPHRRAAEGLVRTFQQLELFGDLTVGENIEVAARNTGRGDAASIASAVDLFGLAGDLDTQVIELSQGRRRLVALARATACCPVALFLDEPAAGLDTGESQALGQDLVKLAEEGVAILLVDHDMSLVMSVCHRITVIDFGRTIAAGSAEDVRKNPAVLAAYLGTGS